MSDEEMQSRVGELIARKYRLERLLGSGGMGAVYAATHEFTKRAVAVKLMHEQVARNKDFAERFIREAQAPSAIGHPGIVEVLDGGFDEKGSLYLVLEMLSGKTLGDDDGPMAVTDLVNVVTQLLDALGAAHKAGFVHRDIKPDNVFLTHDDKGWRKVKLLDFGVAGIREAEGKNSSLTKTGTILGTPTFMSPEQARGDRVDQRSDLWAVGAILYDALAGRPPYEAETYNAVIVSIVTREHIPLERERPDLPRPLLDVIERALRKSVEERWQTAADMASALRAISNLEALSGVVTREVVPPGSAATQVGRARPRPANANASPKPQSWAPALDKPSASSSALPPLASEIREPVERSAVLAKHAGDHAAVQPTIPAASVAQTTDPKPVAAVAHVSNVARSPEAPSRPRPSAPAVASQPVASTTVWWVAGAAVVVAATIAFTVASIMNRRPAADEASNMTTVAPEAIAAAPTEERAGDPPAVGASEPIAAEPVAAAPSAGDDNEPSTTPVTNTPNVPVAAARLTSSDLTAALSTVQGRLQRCYQDTITAALVAGVEPPPALSLDITVKVKANGETHDATIAGQAPSTLTRCMREHLLTLRFRATGEASELNFPVVLQPAVITN